MPSNTAHIRISRAKDELARINDILESPLVLIGGLAVQQYYLARDSFDIDLVCEHEVAMEILRRLYSTNAWEHTDRNHDEYRPAILIRNRIDTDYPVLHFGPKITERHAYSYIRWNELSADGRPFLHKNRKLDNIVIPSVEKLCLMKFASYLGRARTATDKITQDLQDIVSLSNHGDFRLSEFYNSARRWGITAEIRRVFRSLPDAHELEFSQSYLRGIAALFAAPHRDESPITVWIIGSTTDLADEHRLRAYKTADALADAFVARRFRVVMGRNQLLNYVADRVAVDTIEPSTSVALDMSDLLALKSARAGGRCPNPLILLGSLRAGKNAREVFMDSIGQVPDICIVIGGRPGGRAVEEARLAVDAGIPVLPLPFTGGAAAELDTSVHKSLLDKATEVRAMSRENDLIGDRVCEIVETQARISRGRE